MLLAVGSEHCAVHSHVREQDRYPEYLVVCGQVATDAGVLAVGGVANGGPECSIELGGPCTALAAGAGIRHILS